MSKLLAIILTVFLGLPAFADVIKLTTQNTITFRGAVTMASVTEAEVKLAALVAARGKSPYPIYLVFDSPGGSIVAGDNFIQFAKTVPNLETISIFSASMAAGIVQALPGTRHITKNGVLMFHRASGGFEGYFETGEIESQLKFWKSIVLNMELVNANRLGLPIAEYKQKVVGEYWVYGKDAVQDKAADKLVDLICTPELISKREVTASAGMFGPSSEVYSGCPLIGGPIPKSTKEEVEN
jgi:ATP-dependent protease ClpP protease subunit